MMREFTKQRELVRLGITRFATCFLTLQIINMQKCNLRLMFTFDKWLASKWAKEAKGKQVLKIVLMPSFWNHVVYILKVMGPLVKVLQLVDNERKPTMGYIYEARIDVKRPSKSHLTRMRISTRRSSLSLIRDGNVNSIVPCMQQVTS